MCGIIGCFSKSSVTESRLVQGMDAMKHRGPDNQSIKKFANGILGHLRLAIIDLSPTSNQPFAVDDRYTLVFNGEIYNYQEVRAKMISEGIHFTTNSDTEVVIRAYIKYGKDCLQYFNGMFAFVIYDEVQNILFLARDRVGKKPLYYRLESGSCLFSSEIKGLLPMLESAPELNKDAIAEFLSIGYIIAPNTIYNGIWKLEPATSLTVDLTKGTHVKDVYWSPTKSVPSDQTDQELSDLIADSVDLRFVSDVPVGIMLSGGLDSNIVLALSSNRKPKTFTITNRQKQYDEGSLASLSARYFRCENASREVPVDPSLLETLTYYFDEPMADSSSIATFYLSEFIKNQGFRCVLNGDGSDEVFGGYDRYKLLLIYQNFRYLRWLIPDVPIPRFRYKGFFYNLFKLRQLLSAQSVEDAFLDRTIINKGFEGPALQGTDVRQKLQQRLDTCTSDGLNRFIEFDFKYYLPDDLLVKMDRCTMANSLEGRSPFLDYRLVQAMLNVPFERKLSIRTNKIVLRRIFENLLPKAIRKAKKRGFQVPIDYWFIHELRDQIVRLPDSPIVSEGFVKKEYVRSIVDRHLSRKENLKFEIYLILVFDLWYQRWRKQ